MRATSVINRLDLNTSTSLSTFRFVPKSPKSSKAADSLDVYKRQVPVLAGEGMDAVRIGLPEGDDPDSLFRRLGREAFAAYVREAVRQTRPSEEQVLLGRIRKGIGLLSGVAEAEKRERLLRVLEDCLTQLKGLSVGACRPATMDWRWV